MAAVVALKVAVVANAGTVTDAGTVRVVLLFVRMTAAPPTGAGPVSVTVQVEVLELFKVVGRQARELTVGSVPTVTIPPVAESGIALAAAEDATALRIPTAVVPNTPPAMVRLTTPTVPLAMIPVFIPDAMQEYAPDVAEQVQDFPAAVKAAPGLMETETTLARG
jgi:hypothetical protein